MKIESDKCKKNLTGRKRAKKLDRSRKPRKASTEDEKSDKSKQASSSDSEEEKKPDKLKKTRDTIRTGEF